MDPYIGDLNYVGKVPSLKKLSSIRLVFELWKAVDISSAISDHSWKFYAQKKELKDTDHFINFVDDLISRVDNFLPIVLIGKVKYFTMYVGLHLCDWLVYMNSLNFGLNTHDILQFTCLTVDGGVDEYRSIESLVRKFRYQGIRAASYFCLERVALEMLSEGIPLDIQEYCDNCDVNTLSNILLKYWVFKHQKRLSEFSMIMRISRLSFVTSRNYLVEGDFLEGNLNRLMTKVSVLNGNSFAAEYFFSALENVERDRNIDTFFQLAIYGGSFHRNLHAKYFQIAYFFYLHMEPSRQKFIWMEHKNYFSSYMVNNVNFQNRIVSTFSSFWDTLNLEFYCDMMCSIIERLLHGRFVIASLLSCICHATPEELMRQFFAHLGSDVTHLFFFDYDSDFIAGNFFDYATMNERNNIFSYYEI